MKRTPMKPSTKPLKRAPFARTAAREKSPKRIKHGKVPPTAEESAWMAWVADFGCVVCWREHNVKTPCAVHHIVEGGRRKGHMFTLGLCDAGHHQNTPTPEKISRHPNKKRFEAAYGTEYELLAFLQREREKQINGKKNT